MTKTALITGVSSGIGLAQAGIFLENGWRVFGIDLASKPDLAGDFHFLQLDLTGDLSPVFHGARQLMSSVIPQAF